MNKMIRPFLTTLGIALFLGATLTPATAHARRGGGGMRGEMKELNLSAEQKTKMKELRKKGHEEGKKLRAEVKTARDKLRAAAESETSKADLLALFSTVQEKQQVAAKHAFSQAMEVREILTPEQRKKAGAMLGKFFHEKGPRGEKGRGGPRGEGDDEDRDE